MAVATKSRASGTTSVLAQVAKKACVSSGTVTLNISDSLWSQYRTGRVKVPDKLQKEAVNLALLGAAVRIHAAKITRKKDI